MGSGARTLRAVSGFQGPAQVQDSGSWRRTLRLGLWGPAHRPATRSRQLEAGNYAGANAGAHNTMDEGRRSCGLTVSAAPFLYGKGVDAAGRCRRCGAGETGRGGSSEQERRRRVGACAARNGIHLRTMWTAFSAVIEGFRHLPLKKELLTSDQTCPFQR